MVTVIAETACIDPLAQIDGDVVIGPCCVIGPEVTIGRGTILSSHVCLLGRVTLGQSNTIGSFVAIGCDPQDTSYRSGATRVEIGDHNTIHERVTINRASEKEDGITRLGSHNLLMAGAHVAHDCNLGDRITIGSGSMLGGHVHIDDWAYLAEAVAIHQFVTLGRSCFIGGQSKVCQDVPPYVRAEGNPATIVGINTRPPGQKACDAEVTHALRNALRLIYRTRMSLEQVANTLEAHDQLFPEVLSLIKLMEAQRNGKRGRARDHR